MPIKPIHEKILVLPFPPDEISDGGIIVADSYKERPSKATVIATGDGLKDRPMRLKPGDIVFHIKGAGTEVEENGVKYYIMIDRDVLCTLEEGEEGSLKFIKTKKWAMESGLNLVDFVDPPPKEAYDSAKLSDLLDEI